MHFTMQAAGADAARAAAERLALLPPEALIGLSAADRQDIVNFSVPADSLVPAFAALTGRVTAADGTTAIAGARVFVTGTQAAMFKSPVVARTDAAGRYRVNALLPGPFTVQAEDSITGARTAVLERTIDAQSASATQDLTFANAGILTGTVRFPDGTPGGGSHPTLFGQAFVSISGTTQPINVQAPIDNNGRYVAGVLPPGTYTVQWTVLVPGPFFTRFRPAIVTGVQVSAGATTVADVRLGAEATLSVTVRRSDGTPIPGALIDIVDSVAGHRQFVAVTGANGVAVISAVPEGNFSVRVLDPATFAILGIIDGTIHAADEGRVIDLALQLFSGTIGGLVRAGDGQTPVPGATVQLVDAATNSLVSSTGTGADGSYRFDNVTLGGEFFRVVAHSPSNFEVTAEGTGSLATSPVVRNLTLPVSVLTGTVTFADGVTPAASGDIRATRVDADGNLHVLYSSMDGQGRYVIIGLPAGEFSLFARDFYGARTGRESGSITTITAPMVVDVRLGAAGTITGTAKDAAGALLTSTSVYAVSNGMPIHTSIGATTDAQGRYTLERVPLGGFTVHLCHSTTGVCGSAHGRLDAEGQVASADVTLPGVGVASGTLFARDGVSIVPNGWVYLRAGEEGPAGVFTSFVQTDSNGRYQVTGTPAGLVVVVGYDAEFSTMGMAHAQLTAGGSTTIDIGGGADRCNRTLAGTDGFRYDAGCGGELRNGGTIDNTLRDAYRSAYAVRVNGASQTNSNAAFFDSANRQITYEQHQVSGVIAARKLFVPASGGFARYLDTFTNTTAAPVTVEVLVDSMFGGAVRQVVTPGATNNRYAITLGDRSSQSDGEGESGPVVRPLLVHVFGDGNGRVSADAAHFQFLDGNSYYRWTIAIPAGESVTVMHFAAQRAPADTAGAQAQAEGLMNLSDASALLGMTPSERALVVNFRIP